MNDLPYWAQLAIFVGVVFSYPVGLCLMWAIGERERGGDE